MSSKDLTNFYRNWLKSNREQSMESDVNQQSTENDVNLHQEGVLKLYNFLQLIEF
jgi:hypothetical protein